MKTSTHINKILLPLLVLFFSACMAQRPVTHLQFVQTWNPTFCNLSSIKCADTALGEKFSIHGLWPAGNKGESVVNCSKSNVPEDVYKQVEADLNVYWPPIVVGRERRALWNHEWKAHGSCAIISPKGYFEAAISLKKKIDLFTYLRNANIIASMSKHYKMTDIITAVQKGVKHNNINIYVSCRKVKSSYWLNEIFICVDTNDRSKMVDCPKVSSNRGCNGPPDQANIMLPTWKGRLVLSTDLHYEDEGENFTVEGLKGEI